MSAPRPAPSRRAQPWEVDHLPTRLLRAISEYGHALERGANPAGGHSALRRRVILALADELDRRPVVEPMLAELDRQALARRL